MFAQEPAAAADHLRRFPGSLPANADAARFINEIVLGEESDVAPGGGYISHYSLYINAMKEAGANVEKIEMLVELVRNHHHYRRALTRASVPKDAQAFVTDSMSVCLTGKNHEIASYFLFGRENLIPEMFRRIVERLRASGVTGLDGLVYYLDRHIEIDGGEHGPTAEKMLNYLIDGKPRRWAEVHQRTAVRALKSRRKLWDAISLALDGISEGGSAAAAREPRSEAHRSRGLLRLAVQRGRHRPAHAAPARHRGRALHFDVEKYRAR